MKSKTAFPHPSLNWSRIVRGTVIAAAVAAICVISAPAKSSYAVSWGGCGNGGGCAGYKAPPCVYDKLTNTCVPIDTDNIEVK